MRGCSGCSPPPCVRTCRQKGRRAALGELAGQVWVRKGRNEVTGATWRAGLRLAGVPLRRLGFEGKSATPPPRQVTARGSKPKP